MNQTEVIEKVNKLLALSKSSNVHEAAAAAAKAQELIEKYRLDRAIFSGSGRAGACLNDPSCARNQDPQFSHFSDDPLARVVLHTFPGVRVKKWIVGLADTITDLNDCFVWIHDADEVLPSGKMAPSYLEAAGRKTNLAFCKTLLAWLITEVDRLASERGTKKGDAAFRQGAVDRISERLREAKRKMYDAIVAGSPAEDFSLLGAAKSFLTGALRSGYIVAAQAAERVLVEAWVAENVKDLDLDDSDEYDVTVSEKDRGKKEYQEGRQAGDRAKL